MNAKTKTKRLVTLLRQAGYDAQSAEGFEPGTYVIQVDARSAFPTAQLTIDDNGATIDFDQSASIRAVIER